MSDAHLRELIARARKHPALRRVGSMHSMWEAIFDAEAIVRGDRAIMPRGYVEAELEAFLTTVD